MSEGEILVEPDEVVRPGERRCVATRESRSRDGLVRFVLSPAGEVVPDVTERMPGRGLWLTARRPVVEAAAARHLFAKAARQPAKVPPGLADEVERQLARRCVELLGLARRAGEAVIGYDQVLDRLRHDRTALLIVARDAAANQRARLEALAGGAGAIDVLGRDELGRAFGRETVTYAALAQGGLARRFRREAGRLAGFRNEDSPSAGAGAVGGEEDEGIR